MTSLFLRIVRPSELSYHVRPEGTNLETGRVVVWQYRVASVRSGNSYTRPTARKFFRADSVSRRKSACFVLTIHDL